MIKTVTLSGSELSVSGLDKNNTLVINNSDASVFAGNSPNITAYEDGVIEIPAGARDTVVGTNGTVYLLGTGRVELRGVDYVGFSKPSTSEGGGGLTSSYVLQKDEETLLAAKKYADDLDTTTVDDVNDMLNSIFV